MISKVKSDYLKLIISTILGVACGTAWMTNIRYHRIGISELFFFFFIILFFINKVDFFKIEKNLLSIVKFFLFFLFFLIAPYFNCFKKKNN